MLVPEHKETTNRLVNLRAMQVKGVGWVELCSWKPEISEYHMGKKPLRVGIKGLPFHLWSMGFFRAVGGALWRVFEGGRRYKKLEIT